jgi:predicted dehydrogenase
MERLPVAVIGLGSMGRSHVRVLSSLAEVELVTVCDSDPKRLISGKWMQVTDYRDARASDFAYCVVATPTLTHLEVCKHFLSDGVPVLLEKPAASTADEVRELIATRTKHAGHVSVGMIERFNRTAQEARNLVMSKQMGSLLKMSMCRVGPPPGRDMGVGVLTDLGIHDLDLARWITGSEVSGSQALAVSQVVSSHEDYVLLAGHLVGGAIISVELSWLHPLKQRSIEMLFTSGLARFDLLSGEVSLSELSGETIEWDAVREFFGTGRAKRMVYGVKTVEPLVVEHQSMVHAVRTGEWSNLPSLEESLQLLESLETMEFQSPR